MKEFLLTLSLERLDELLAFVGETLTEYGCPTQLRIQAEIVAEELYTTALYNEMKSPVRMSCVVHQRPAEVVFRLRSREGALKLELESLHRLQRQFPDQIIQFGGDDGVYTLTFKRT